MEKYKSTEAVFEAAKFAIDKNRLPSGIREYLVLFQGNRLSMGGDRASLSYEVQRDKLIQLMCAKYMKGRGWHQTISRLEGDMPHFFELLLMMSFLNAEKEIELTDNIGYDRYEVGAGIYSLSKFPHAEYMIVGKELKDKITKAAEPQQPVAYNARVLMQGRSVCVELTGDKVYIIANLEEGRPTYLFMEYLLSPSNFDIDITIGDVRAIKGCASINTLTEPIRYSGFNKLLKKAFFPTVKRDRIRFRNTTLLNSDQIESVKIQATKLENKS